MGFIKNKIAARMDIILLEHSVSNVMSPNTGTQLLKNVLLVNMDRFGTIIPMFVTVALHQDKSSTTSASAQQEKPGLVLIVFAQLELMDQTVWNAHQKNIGTPKLKPVFVKLHLFGTDNIVCAHLHIL